MDTKIKLLILSLFSAFSLFGQSPLSLAVRYNISSATGGDPYTVTGVVSDDLSRFTGSDVQVGDSLYVIDGSDLYVLKITAINSVVGPTVNLTADDPSNAGISLPTGQSAIVRPTPNYKLPIYIAGLRDDLRSMMMNRQAKIIDQITGGGSSSITDFTSAGENVPPSAAASSNTGETWRNMTTGELWGSNGTNWYPYTRGPKECQDTVLVSSITVQSGGSVTTGSPLVRNTSGVWQHMYNHPSGTNLVPDGVVTDIIVGGRAIIQYCGVRKGSGATPNTSYYVDQTISTGFTTTKPATNIRPLGKVASNGDFLINAGLLFSRDNSQALPINQIGFGNTTGTAITSDTTLKFNPTTDKLRVSSPSNKGYVELDKSITINPDTIPTGQTYFEVKEGRSSPYTYAPFRFGSEYGSQGAGGPYPYKDYVWHFGPNSGGNGTAIDPTKPMSQIVWETSWLSSNVPFYEIHFPTVKFPDSNAIRLLSYTINYKNGLFPSASPAFTVYHTVDRFSLKGATIFNSAPTYFQVEKSRTSNDAQMFLYSGTGSNWQFYGSAGNYYITGTGSTTQSLFLNGFNDLLLEGSNGTRRRIFSSKPLVYQSNTTTATQHLFDNEVGQTTNPILRVYSTFSNTTFLNVHGNGNTAIGNLATAPTNKLHVVGDIRATVLNSVTATNVTGSDANGVLANLTLGSRLTITSGTLNVAATLMREESFTATAAQTAFTIAYSAPAVSGTSVPIRVYRNGVRLFYVASGPTITQFTYSGTTVTTAANTAGDIITIEYLN